MDCEHYAILKLLSGQLWSFRTNNFLCDTTIVASDRDLPAHSVVLAAGSSSFRAAFEGSSSGDETRYRVKIPHMSGDAIEAVLFLIYNGCGPNPNQTPDGEFLYNCEQLGVCFIKDRATKSEVASDLEWIKSRDAYAESTLASNADAIVHVGLFEHDELLSDPLEQVVLDRKLLVCDLCSKLFDNEAHFEAHTKSHVATYPLKPYACDLCPLIFRTMGGLRRHCVGHEGHTPQGPEPTTYECWVCLRKFPQKKSLTKHFRLHRDDANSGLQKHEKLQKKEMKDRKPIECDGDVVESLLLCKNNSDDKCALGCICRSKLSTVTVLDKRSEEKSLVCDKCGRSFKHAETLERHRASHEREGHYVCCVCHKGFRQHHYLRKHLRLHDAAPTHRCELCPKTFRVGHLLRRHMSTHDSTEARFRCGTCGRTFRQEYYLRKHFQRHGAELNYACEYCGKRFKENYQLLKHARIHSTAPRYPCGTCNRTFRDEWLLRRHRSVHEARRAHPCEVCGKAFKVQASLISHRRLHSVEMLICAVCGLTLGSVRELRRHELAAHSIAPPAAHQCCECGKLFASATHLRSHSRTHSSERPHACPVCQRTFRRQADMRSHVLTHTGAKTNLCSTCGKGFLKKSDLKRHFLAHRDNRPYVCDTCGKGFKLLNYLKEHLHTHSANKEFVCYVCNRAFNSIGNLKNHRKIHSGVKPHRCPVCAKEFLRPANLRSHLRVHVKNSEPAQENLADAEKIALSDGSVSRISE